MTSKKAEAAAEAGEQSIADGQGQPFDFCRADGRAPRCALLKTLPIISKDS